MASNKKGKKYKCPYCDYRDYRPELIDHVEEEHEEMIPKGYTPSRVVYNTINKKDHGTCMVCHKETKWDEDKQRYDSLCGRPKCKQEYVKIVRSRMVKKYGTYNLLTNPEFQKKMLEGRSISGKYKFQDGGSVGYVGSYEKKFLEFMDTFLHIKSYDIISPGPNIPYMYKGKEHVWITDFLYEPYNLVFDIKDGGDNPNTRDMAEYREKQIAKEKAIAEYGDYNYIRLTDNKFEQLISIFMELKEKTDEKPLIRINESFIQEETYIEELGVLEMTFAVFLALFWGSVGAIRIKEYINKKVEENAYHYEVTDRPLKNIPKYGNVRAKDALAYYAYYSLKIRKSEKGTLLYTSNNKSNLNKHVYLYKFNKNKLVLVEEGKFIDICEKNNVKIKSLDESKLSGREEAYNLAVNIIKKEINKYADLKKHASIGEDDKEYYSNFINGIDDDICVLRCDLWDVVPNARSDEGDELASKKVWNPYDEMIKIINSKLPKNFKVDHGGDWDDLMILLTHKVSIKESYVNEETTEYMNKLTAFHLEPVIPKKKRPIGGWDEELYSKNMEYAILNDIKSNWYVKDQTSVKAYVYTSGKDLKAIYLGTIYIPDKNKSGWEWDEKEMLSDDIYDYLKSNPMTESYIEESKNKSSFKKNFKKKSGIKYDIYDIHDPKALKYIKKDPKWKDAVDYIQNNCNGEIAVDPNTQKIIGRILIKQKEQGTSISGFYVDNDYRGYGLGSTLFQDAVDKYNGEILGVYADNKVAINMYKKHGFKTIETQSDADGKYYIMKRESSISEETRIDKDKLPKFIYHISSENHDGETFEPRKYDNENVKNDMERYVARVCFADRIDGCLYSIFPNGAYDAEFYVHVPGNEVKVYSTTKDDVYDSEITHELWVKEPVEMKCIGKIKVTGVSNNKTKIIDIESDKVPYNKKKYHKCIWKWVEKYDKDESLFE